MPWPNTFAAILWFILLVGCVFFGYKPDRVTTGIAFLFSALFIVMAVCEWRER